MQFHLRIHEFTMLCICAHLLLFRCIGKILFYLPENTKIIQKISALQQICTERYKLYFPNSCPATNEFPRQIISHYDELTHIFIFPATVYN